MRRPPAATILTWLVYAALVVVVIFAFLIQQDRISRGNDRYDNLFVAYQELAGDCDRADDCFTDAPTPAEVAESEPGAPGATGATGAQGARGFDGQDGFDGSDGQDGTPGTPGSPGADGADGADGAPGAPGAPGADGDDGEPPASWTFEHLGVTFTCTRTDPFDATAPTYTCN